jgi:hypothetical protein
VAIIYALAGTTAKAALTTGVPNRPARVAGYGIAQKWWLGTL